VSCEISSQTVLSRSQRSISNIIRRWFTGRRKQTGFQGTAQVNQPYSFGSYGSASSSYPSFAYPLYPGYSYSPNLLQNGYNSGYQSYSGYPLAASASSQYPTYTPGATFTPQSYGSSPGTMDFNQVLDQFVRSAGLSPQGDHEAQSLQSKGDSFAQSETSPVFSFKKLYSFPFYLSTDQNSGDGYNYQMPFLKRHNRRMSPEAQLIQNSLNQQLLAKQFLVPPVIKSEQSYPQSESHNLKPEKQLSHQQNYLQAEDIEQQL
jgi:hypothetical protein